MLSLTLFGRDLRENYKLLLIFIAVLGLYAAMVVSMFDPALGQSLDMMASNMEGVFAAFGMDGAGVTMEAFLANYLYGFLLIVLPLIFLIILSGRLVARHTTRGSMAYLLSSSCSRGKLIRTQAIFLIFLTLVLVAVVCGLCILVSEMLFPDALALEPFLLLNAALLGLLLAIGGMCFFFSCLFQDSKKAIGVSAALVILFLLFQMISSVGDKFEILQYLTPLTLFDPIKLLDSTLENWVLIGGFYVTALILFILSGSVFSKKSLRV